MYTEFPNRIIVVGKLGISSKEVFEHSVTHELVHALQFETWVSQNMFSNGKNDDTFDSEYIAEFMTIYSGYLLELRYEVMSKLNLKW